ASWYGGQIGRGIAADVHTSWTTSYRAPSLPPPPSSSLRSSNWSSTSRPPRPLASRSHRRCCCGRIRSSNNHPHSERGCAASNRSENLAERGADHQRRRSEPEETSRNLGVRPEIVLALSGRHPRRNAATVQQIAHAPVVLGPAVAGICHVAGA